MWVFASPLRLRRIEAASNAGDCARASCAINTAATPAITAIRLLLKNAMIFSSEYIPPAAASVTGLLRTARRQNGIRSHVEESRHSPARVRQHIMVRPGADAR